MQNAQGRITLDGWLAYESRVKEIRQHNQSLLESIFQACPAHHLVVISQSTTEADPYQWLKAQNANKPNDAEALQKKEDTGMHAFLPDDGMLPEQALNQISAESRIRRFWFVPVEG